MEVLLVFSVALVVAVLLSGLAERTILSTAVLFLAVGFLAGAVFGVFHVQATDPLVSLVAELALFSILFTDGMRTSLPELASTWHLPGRALFLGLPITLLIVAVLAYLLVGVTWTEALLLGAVLSPTDPVFAAAIIGRREVPERLRRLLNVESGLNDGLALPIVLLMLAVVAGEQTQVLSLGAEIVLGVLAGIAIPWAVVALEKTPYFVAAKVYQPLNAFAIGLLLLAVTKVTHVNEFLAAFAGGITVATASTVVRNSFRQFGETLSELLKLAAILVFGALLSPSALAGLPLGAYVFAILVLFLARPLALAIALFRTRLSRKEWIAAAWFGPKGFASVLYGLFILEAGIARGGELFHIAALTIALSILLHSSTDVIVARWFETR